MKINFAIFWGLMLIFSACQRQETQASEVFQFLFPSENHLLRQSDIGISTDSLKQLESQKEKHEDLLGITYEYRLNNGISIFIEYYSDRKNQTQNITAVVVNILNIDPIRQAELYDEIKKLFRQRYGPSRGQYGKESWEGERQDGKMEVHIRFLKSEQGLSINFVSK